MCQISDTIEYSIGTRIILLSLTVSCYDVTCKIDNHSREYTSRSKQRWKTGCTAAMTKDLKKWGKFSAILEDPGMRSSRKVIIGDGMDRQDIDRWRIVIRSQKQRQSRKKEPKKLDLGNWHWPYFFNVVQSIQFIYTSLAFALYIRKKN